MEPTIPCYGASATAAFWSSSRSEEVMEQLSAVRDSGGCFAGAVDGSP